MYPLWRRVHLYTGMTLLIFVVMYFVTGYIMIHPNLMDVQDPVKTVRALPWRAPDGDPPKIISDALRNAFHLPGQRQPPQKLKDGRWRFRYAHPGEEFTVVVSARRDSVEITRTEGNMRAAMVGFHRLHGYGGGWLYNIWAVFYDLASAAMIVFALSGIYMWYTLEQRRLLGWIFLAISYGFAAWVVLYLVHMP